MTQLVIIGAGGHARVLVEALGSRRSEIIGFVTSVPESASGVMTGIPRLGDDRDLLARGSGGLSLINGIGSIGDPQRHRTVFEDFAKAGFAFATIVHPTAIIASDVVLGTGAQIMAGCVLQPGVRVGSNAIVNTGAIIDHDSVIGDHAHIAPGATLSGHVDVGSSSHVGTGAAIIQGIRIGAGALIAAGAVVAADVASGSSVA